MPCIEELKDHYNGVTLDLQTSTSITICAMLTCIGSDLPATRKVCGFLSYNATMGCSKCLKQFTTLRFGDKPDYSGYDTDQWEPRLSSLHKQHAQKVREAAHPTAEHALQRKFGLKYSVLLDLSYFDIIRYHTIDPMHNIFLGIGKKTTKTWIQLRVLTDSHFKDIQRKVDSPNIGRIPRKISSGFSSFTADDWILIYSLYALSGCLPANDFNCWYLFVEACKKM